MEKVDFNPKSVGIRNSFTFRNLEVSGVLLGRVKSIFFSSSVVCANCYMQRFKHLFDA